LSIGWFFIAFQTFSKGADAFAQLFGNFGNTPDPEDQHNDHKEKEYLQGP